MQTTVTAVAGDKVSFYWKVSSEEYEDYLKFYIDDQYQDQISGEVDWQKKSYSLSAGSRTLKWVYSKNSSTSEGDDCGWVDGLVVGTGSLVIPPDDYSEAVDSHLKFTKSGDGHWFVASGSSDYYYDGDAIHSVYTADSNESCLQTIVESDSSETIKFHWKVSSETDADYLEFYIDDSLQDRISGEVDWQQKSYTVSSGIHTLKWVYVKNWEDEDGDDCGWVDYVQWSGPSPEQDPLNFQTIDYKYDLYSRRSEKKVDGYSTRYVYDGPHVIAEYDGNNNLLRKYIYGPGIDQPVCMIEVADSNATYYYHYDGLGSVVALSDSSGDTVQTYQYSIYGQVAVEDISHPNPYMFAGRRFDIEIGLYYNRARYYNPYTGRFLQADPIGYGDGMNMYAYCRNNPLNYLDPSGCGIYYSFFSFPVECITDVPGEYPYFDFQGWLDSINDPHYYMNGWRINRVELYAGHYHVRFSYYIPPEEEEENDPPAPPIWAIKSVNPYTTRHRRSGDPVKVVTLNGIGLLDEQTLHKIVDPLINVVEEWNYSIPIDWPMIEWEMGLLDTGFHFTGIDTWMYHSGEYHKSDVNYFGIGYAMNQLEMTETMGTSLVRLWKIGKGSYPTDDTWFWWIKGWKFFDLTHPNPYVGPR